MAGSIGDFLLLCLTFQGLVLSALLFYSSKKIKSNYWLAAFIFLISYCTLQTDVLNSALPHNFPWIYFVLPQLRLALGPLLYFYTRSLLLEKRQLTRQDKLQFLPLIIESGPQIAFFFRFSGLLSITAIRKWYYPLEQFVMNFETSVSGTLPFFGSFLICTIFCYRLVRENSSGAELSPLKLRDLKWLKTLLMVVFSITVIWFITIILSYSLLPQFISLLRYVTILIAIGFAYWLGMSAYARQFKMSANDVFDYNKAPKKIYSILEAEKYEQRLSALMATERLYLNPSLKVNILAEHMEISEKQLSLLLNQHIGKSFNDYINEYRVQAAKQKLTDGTCSKFTIASIGLDCGFNSLATFQRCFKQFTGLTPSQFQTIKITLKSPQIVLKSRFE